MTDKELIQAFRWCSKCKTCEDCPVTTEKQMECHIAEFSSEKLVDRMEALLADKEKLQAYEDTGLEPQEINRIVDAYGRGMTLRAEVGQRLEIVREIPTDKLREIAEAYKEAE